MLKDINNWNKIPVDTYKTILEEAKVRYNELLSQSENITGKVIQTILAVSAIVAWFTKYLSENKFQYRLVIAVVFVIFTISIYYRLVSILYPRKTVLRGTSPSEALGNEVDLAGDIDEDKYSETEKTLVYYYHQVYRYNRRINTLRSLYNIRARNYKINLVLCLILFFYIILVVLFTGL